MTGIAWGPRAEVAAHLVDHVLPPLPVRHWVLSVPKRIRPFLPRDPALGGAVLRGTATAPVAFNARAAAAPASTLPRT
jgi:hypothetical protein